MEWVTQYLVDKYIKELYYIDYNITIYNSNAKIIKKNFKF